MSEAIFKFISSDIAGDPFTVVSFKGNEAISTLYRYEIEIKAPLSANLDLDDVLASSATFISIQGDQEYPVHGVLSRLDELQTVLGYVYYRVVLVPQLWRLSIYKTNEIYTYEKTVDAIIETVLKAGGFVDTDFDLGGLDSSKFLNRNYVCQFGESDFDFISRLMENEGIYYYFEQTAGAVSEKIIFTNEMNYSNINSPELFFDVAAQASQQHDCINAWQCRRKRLAKFVTVRNFNPDQPSLDISDTMPIDSMGQGTEYIYGENVFDQDEATYLANIRAEEHLCYKTRYHGKSMVSRLQAGYSFSISRHPNTLYNTLKYLVVKVRHEGQNLDMSKSGGSSDAAKTKPQYHNSFVAINANEQYRPARTTLKPRFYGTMTAFIYSETGTNNAEIDESGRYRVLLPFDRSDGTLLSTDPDRKASTWMRMAQPYVGQEQGMYFPLLAGTEVLLTFINGDPDQPVISSALPNAAQPSLLTSELNLQRTITQQISQTVSGNTHTVSMNSASISSLRSSIESNTSDIAGNTANIVGNTTNIAGNTANIVGNTTSIAALRTQLETKPGSALGTWYINENMLSKDVDTTIAASSLTMIPPWEGLDLSNPAYDHTLIKFKLYGSDLIAKAMSSDHISDENDEGFDATKGDKDHASYENTYEAVSTDRGAGDNYVYANGRTFAYPQHERVYFIGTFHEDFHVKDDFMDKSLSWTGKVEQWNFPAPGKDYPAGKAGDTHTNAEVNPKGIRGVSEDRRWGSQMTYAYGASYNWGGGDEICGAGVAVNYGNGITEDLINSTGGRFKDVVATAETDDRPEAKHWDMYKKPDQSPAPDRAAGTVPNPYTPRDYAKKFVKHNDKDVSAAYAYVDGNTYSYQCGHDLDVNVGESDSWSYGDSRDYVFGHSSSWVNGDSISYTLGSETSMLFGNSNSMAIGFTTDTFVGIKTETMVGGTIKFELAGETGVSAVSDKFLKSDWKTAAAKKDEATLEALIASLIMTENTVKKNLSSVSMTIDTKARLELIAGGSIDLMAGLCIFMNASITKIG
jgi:type VI secretion system secreted protein VgrG